MHSRMRAALYVRISQDRSGARGGVGRQLEDCEKLCATRGWTVGGVYEDNDVSAYSGRQRPAYARLMGDVADGLIDVVVAWHPDRLWRSVIEQQVAVAEWRRAGLGLVATCTGGEVDPSSADDEFVSTVIAAVAAKESADKARRARRKAEELVADGRHTGGGRRPFGHSVDRESVVDEEAALVLEACTRVVAGEDLASVVVDWRGRGVLTSTGLPWRYGSVLKLLRQPRLAGLSVHRGQIVGEARWPEVVPRPLWERAQASLDARAAAPRSAPTRSVLGGLLRCGRCSAHLVAGGTAYRCPSRSQGGCGGVGVGRAWLEEVVGGAVAAYVSGPEYARAVAERAADSTALDAALAAVAEAESRVTTLDAMFSAGEMVGGDYRTMRSRLAEVLEEARAAVSAAAGVGGGVADPNLDWEGLGDGQRRAVVVAVVAAITVDGVGRGRSSTVDRLSFEWR